MKFRQKLVVVDAVQFSPADWEGSEPNRYECGVNVNKGNKYGEEGRWWISTVIGARYIMPGDWIIKGVNGEKRVCKPDKFAQTYEEVKNE